MGADESCPRIFHFHWWMQFFRPTIGWSCGPLFSVTGFGTVEEGADRILQCPGSLGGLLPPAAGQRRATSVICCQHRKWPALMSFHLPHSPPACNAINSGLICITFLLRLSPASLSEQNEWTRRLTAGHFGAERTQSLPLWLRGARVLSGSYQKPFYFLVNDSKACWNCFSRFWMLLCFFDLSIQGFSSIKAFFGFKNRKGTFVVDKSFLTKLKNWKSLNVGHTWLAMYRLC